MDIPLIIGSTGAALLLLGFTLLNVEKIKRESYGYQLINFVAASMLLAYAIILNSLPFMILNGVWAAVALYEIGQLRFRAAKT